MMTSTGFLFGSLTDYFLLNNVTSRQLTCGTADPTRGLLNDRQVPSPSDGLNQVQTVKEGILWN